jgi:hypothetical protein
MGSPRNGVADELLRQTAPPEETEELIDKAEGRGDSAPPRKRPNNGKATSPKPKDRANEGGKLTVRPDILWRLHIWSKERGITMKAIADGILDRTVPRYEVKRIGKAVEGEE